MEFRLDVGFPLDRSLMVIEFRWSQSCLIKNDDAYFLEVPGDVGKCSDCLNVTKHSLFEICIKFGKSTIKTLQNRHVDYDFFIICMLPSLSTIPPGGTPMIRSLVSGLLWRRSARPWRTWVRNIQGSGVVQLAALIRSRPAGRRCWWRAAPRRVCLRNPNGGLQQKLNYYWSRILKIFLYEARNYIPTEQELKLRAVCHTFSQVRRFKLRGFPTKRWGNRTRATYRFHLSRRRYDPPLLRPLMRDKCRLNSSTSRSAANSSCWPGYTET